LKPANDETLDSAVSLPGMLIGPAKRAEIDPEHALWIVRNVEWQWMAFATALRERLTATPYSSSSDRDAKEHAYELLKRHMEQIQDPAVLPALDSLTWDTCDVPSWVLYV
jgi:hypothetical protein